MIGEFDLPRKTHILVHMMMEKKPHRGGRRAGAGKKSQSETGCRRIGSQLVILGSAIGMRVEHWRVMGSDQALVLALMRLWVPLLDISGTGSWVAGGRGGALKTRIPTPKTPPVGF